MSGTSAENNAGAIIEEVWKGVAFLHIKEESFYKHDLQDVMNAVITWM